MATKYVEYKTGDAGYNAMVEDMTNAFPWDDIMSSGSNTVFKKFNDGEDYVAFIVTRQEVYTPSFQVRRSKGGTIATADPWRQGHTSHLAYAYGAGFLALNAAPQTFPVGYSGSTNSGYAIISRCTNLVSGDTGYCLYAGGYNSAVWYSKHSNAVTSVPTTLRNNSIIGIAHPFHDEISGDVADNNILLLRAIPDDIQACLTPVNFNGKSYTRMGRLLVATS